MISHHSTGQKGMFNKTKHRCGNVSSTTDVLSAEIADTALSWKWEIKVVNDVVFMWWVGGLLVMS